LCTPAAGTTLARSRRREELRMTQQMGTLSPDEVIAALGLEPGTCGFMATSYRSPLQIAPAGAPVRTIGQALYFLVTPQARVRLHRICSDQIYHHYAGDPLEVMLIPENAAPHTAVVGPDLAGGQRPQLLIPARTFHAGRVVPGGTAALLGTTSWPGVADGEFEAGDAAALAARHPEIAGVLAEFTADG
jgi:predicted cupin superfamily sugar epimerase